MYNIMRKMNRENNYQGKPQSIKLSIEFDAIVVKECFVHPVRFLLITLVLLVKNIKKTFKRYDANTVKT